jgi:hypothetical protein
MTDRDKTSPTGKRISEKQRFSYIGFEVFPGTPKDLFKSDAEKQKYERDIAAKREKGEVMREYCTLLESRVSRVEQIVLTVASVVMFLALLLPWYSAYTETKVAAPTATAQTSAPGTTPPAGAQPADRGVTSVKTDRANEEIITGRQVRARTARTYTTVSGLGAFVSIGDVLGNAFSSGIAVWFSALLMLGYGLLALGLPALNIYTLYFAKGTPDERVIELKKNLRYNWLPLCILAFVLLVSFVGADYGFPAKEMFTSLGDSYGPGVLLSSLSWGVFVTMAASVLVAAKGIEI